MRERTDHNITSVKHDYLCGFITRDEAIDWLDEIEYRDPADIVANWDDQALGYKARVKMHRAR